MAVAAMCRKATSSAGGSTQQSGAERPAGTPWRRAMVVALEAVAICGQAASPVGDSTRRSGAARPADIPRRRPSPPVRGAVYSSQKARRRAQHHDDGTRNDDGALASCIMGRGFDMATWGRTPTRCIMVRRSAARTRSPEGCSSQRNVRNARGAGNGVRVFASSWHVSCKYEFT